MCLCRQWEKRKTSASGARESEGLGQAGMRVGRCKYEYSAWDRRIARRGRVQNKQDIYRRDAVCGLWCRSVVSVLRCVWPPDVCHGWLPVGGLKFKSAVLLEKLTVP